MERFKFFVKENIRLLLGLAVVIFFLILAVLIIVDKNRSTEILVNGNKFIVTVAKSEQDKQIGLSNTKNLPQDHGMLFVFNKPDKYRFWMKDMKYPIDIIYIKGNKVTTIIPNAPTAENGNLTVYEPDKISDKVLEVNAGLAKKYNIQEGSEITIKNL